MKACATITGLAAVVVSVLSCLIIPLSSASTINVPANQPTIQQGINAAANGDTVVVAAGTYKENINFNGKAITVTSASGPAVTIIDGGQNGAVVTFSLSEPRTAVLSGFTIRNASQSGVYINGASPTVRNNVIVQNNSYIGGCAFYLYNAGPSIQANVMVNNGPWACNSGTIYITGSSAAQVTGNIISGNASTGIEADYVSSPLNVVSNTITENRGNGINYSYSNSGAQLTLIQNVIADNQGVGVFWSNPPVVMVNNTITNNSSSWFSEASEVWGNIVNNQITMENNLLVATGSTAAFSCDNYSYTSLPIFDHNDVFSVAGLAYGSVCPDVTGTSGNVSVDPLFAAILSDNVHLQTGSPVINQGNNLASQLPSKDMDGDARIIGTAVDIGADEYAAKTTLTLSTYNLRFASQNVGTTSGAKTITLSNHGTTAVNISLIATGSEFSQTSTCGATLAAGASCQVSIKFSPLGSGIRTSVLGVVTGGSLNPLTAVLTGAGLAPSVSINPPYPYFPSQMIGTSGTQTATLTNTGQAPLTISGIAMSGSTDFTQTNNCPASPATLAVGGSCNFTLTWRPQIVGYEYAAITITDNASPSTQGISLSGSSYSAGVASLSPNTLTFPTTLLGSTSAAQTVTLTNTGTGPLGNISVSSYYDFPATNNCPAILGIGASCTIGISFAPSQVGLNNGYVWVYDDGASGATISVSGQGQAPVPTIASLSPASVAAGSNNTSVTITGTGFIGGTQVLYNGVPLWTWNNGQNQLSFNLPTATVANPGTGTVTVYNPSPGGGTSNALTFTIYPPINYAVTSTTYSYKTITGTNLNLYPWSSAQITSPFAIQFGGGSFTTLTVGGSGAISFSGLVPQYNQPMPDSYLSTLVAPFWGPLYPFGTGNNNNVFWQVVGTAPSRQLVIEWRNVEDYNALNNNQTVTFEVVFYEGNGKILVNYADTVFGGTGSADDNGATSTVGVQVSPTIGTQYSYDTPSLASGTSLLWYPNAPTATVSSSTLNFGWAQIGTPTPAQKLTLTNGSLVTLHMHGISTSNSDFTSTNTCGASVAAGASCSIYVTFNPSTPVAESATLTINDDAIGAQLVTLNGIGAINPIVVFPTQLRFGLQTVGTSSTLPVTLANATNKKMTIQQIAAAPSVYTQTNNCGISLAVGASCTINVTFTPTAIGLVNGTLSMALNGTASQVMVNLSGQGQ
jgi:Right handed beta helix region/Abnormal spindle-like microcephaly-assoc'd, ASPM-SPD-2-Hydin